MSTAHQRGETTSNAASSSSHLPRSDQPCKECTRRRAGGTCDRSIPQCGTCVRAHRHCLYERHARTPLTRKHLTEVEARLERAEALLRENGISLEGRTAGSIDINGEAQVTGDAREKSCGGVSGFSTWPSGQLEFLKDPRFNEQNQRDGAASPQWRFPDDSRHHPIRQSHTGGSLEDPPVAPEDLDWDEQTTPMVFGDSRSWREHVANLEPPPESDGFNNILDGMALLSVEGREIGYMGVTSGAAFLRYLYRPSEGSTSSAWSPSTKKISTPKNSTSPPDPTLPIEPSPSRIIADSFIDAYFALFHPTLPILHEPSFRAAFNGQIARPGGTAWTALANTVAAIGSFSAMTECLTVDTPYFYEAKAALSIECLETGSLTLVQALALMSYYFQKRNKPNSGYTYAGLAARMAFGLGLHREFPSWNLPPLKREIRRRVFWSVFVVDGSICVTLSRPVSSVRESTDIPFPMNVNEAQIDESTSTIPPESSGLTINTPLRVAATFYLAADNVYKRLIKHPYPKLDELIRLDDQHLTTWHMLRPQSFRADSSRNIGEGFALSHLVAMCRYRNLRMVIFRPFLIPLLRKTGGLAIRTDASPAEYMAYERCVTASRDTIAAIWDFWRSRAKTRLAAWYILYFSFQATLIPLVCLRTSPFSEQAQQWRDDIRAALDVIEDIKFIHGSKCAAVIHELADPYMSSAPLMQPFDGMPGRMLETEDFSMLFPTDGSFDFESDVAWHMVWPDATSPAATFGGRKGSIPMVTTTADVNNQAMAGMESG